MSNCKGIFIVLGTSTVNVGSKNVPFECMLGSKVKFLGSSTFVLLLRSTSNAFIGEEFECGVRFYGSEDWSYDRGEIKDCLYSYYFGVRRHALRYSIGKFIGTALNY